MPRKRTSARSVIETALAQAADPEWKSALVELIEGSRKDGVPDEVIAECIERIERDAQRFDEFLRAELGLKKPGRKKKSRT